MAHAAIAPAQPTGRDMNQAGRRAGGSCRRACTADWPQHEPSDEAGRRVCLLPHDLEVKAAVEGHAVRLLRREEHLQAGLVGHAQGCAKCLCADALPLPRRPDDHALEPQHRAALQQVQLRGLGPSGDPRQRQSRPEAQSEQALEDAGAQQVADGGRGRPDALRHEHEETDQRFLFVGAPAAALPVRDPHVPREKGPQHALARHSASAGGESASAIAAMAAATSSSSGPGGAKRKPSVS
eukprot:CAMPEP_0176284978 /NCGR_PEP_ID=MMETSP0121_2-20121125/52129_1 /TAXON_ID=160619 /ORGANISM="Kryptoperidinium foliaceum, Strain CCMP 1326" /LENGTH=238 /DNA_ID=CAMNT_0017625441 /DNA_START=32 /DNA_END=745 /DNA_ORIENTATION=+